MAQSEAQPSQPSQFQQPVIRESDMPSQPQTKASGYRASGKLEGRVALITGGDSGIGHAVAITFAKEGADVAIVYHDAHEDAQRVKQEVEQQVVKGHRQKRAYRYRLFLWKRSSL